jgi:hypothetical protein
MATANAAHAHGNFALTCHELLNFIRIIGLNGNLHSRFIVIEPVDAVPGQPTPLAGTVLGHCSFYG